MNDLVWQQPRYMEHNHALQDAEPSMVADDCRHSAHLTTVWNKHVDGRETAATSSPFTQ